MALPAKILIASTLLSITLLLGTFHTSAQATALSFSPAVIRQGDPFIVQIDGTEISQVKKIIFAGKKINFFKYQDKVSALVGIDLNKKPGTYELQVEFSDGTILKKDVEIEKRDKRELPLGIPEKLGGNTKASQDKLVATLIADNKILANIRTNKKTLWTNPFIPPFKEIFVTDPYGNSRKTGGYSIAHKGTDYRAKDGTEVMAINRGVVRIIRTFRNHGKTIVIDHGMGVMSFYLHMSKFKVKVGDIVKQGQIIGLSGSTGYTQGAHLHLGIRIGNIAIDPEKFFMLFQ